MTALDSWLAMEGGAGRKPYWRVLGRAVAAGTGEYAVDIRGLTINADQLQAESLRLAGPDENTVEGGYPVLDVTHDGTVLRIRVPDFADLEDPCLWLHQQPATFLIKSLRDGIAGVTDDGLAGLLARGEPGGQLSSHGLPAGSLLPAQDLAYRACVGTGLWLVWGPPGTGKTSVLKRAISDLIAAGKRVLLVSATNIAVDNALLGVVKEQRHSPGQLVRVGPPHLKQIADDPQVCLPLMVRAKLTAIDGQREAVAAELSAQQQRARHLAALITRLADFDADHYTRQRRRLDDPALAVEHLTAQLAACSDQHRDLQPLLAQAEDRAEQARHQHDNAAGHRAAWAEIDALEAEAADVEAAATSAEARALLAHQELADAQQVLDDLEAKKGLAKLAARSAIAAAEKHRDATLARHQGTFDKARQARALADRHRLQTHATVSRLSRQIPLTRDDLAAIDTELHQADNALRQTRDAEGDAAARIVHLDEQLRLTLAASEDVKKAERRGHPATHREAQALRPQVAADATRHPLLIKQHRELHEQYERLARDAQGQIIREARLVATTLARFRTNPTVFEGPYDVVLVDEVGAATLPEVLLAVAKAKTTAVLLGDFMQLGPVLPEALKGSQRSDIRRWLLTEVFEHCRIGTPAAARANPGCISLDVQHRFGPDVMRLANTIAYDGLLTGGPTVHARARAKTPDDAEIVIVDTDGLGGLAQIHRLGPSSGWWPAGLLLARTLVELHRADGDTTGIVTPYGAQAEATLAALRDIEGDSGLLAEVGTAHRFQGREFPVVIFDLVEEQHSRGMWMAQASRRPGSGDWANNGVRLFNVATTRVQNRLYLIGSRSRILAAPHDTALGAVRGLVEAGAVRTIRATSLVTPLAAEAPGLGPVGARLADILSRHVEIADVQDEVAFYKTFADRLAEAKHSLWIWTPWVAKRVRSLLPALEDAVRRGVQVTVFVRDQSDQNQQRFTEYLDELKAVTPSVISVNVMHQKIVVIDEQTVLLGSLNALSQSHSREIMLTVRGAHFARKILEHEHAEDFARPPRCAGCQGDQLDLRRGKAGWYWRCYDRACPARKGDRGWTVPVQFTTSRSKRGSR
ncbi:AAA domain-containing protein [Kitasatospora sp. NPDC001539]|uniref:AAA domain-containing protein n=1 Tax=Kitasatospora sp. NPDC001539 TaxID=3154384 RepID=UPI00331BA203